MKYIRYTYVDVKTQAPVSQEPARNGPAHPDGVTPTFAIESSFGPTPAFYGIAEDDFVVKDWMYEMSEEQFFSDFQAELKERVYTKRKQIESSGITVDVPSGPVFVRTDSNSQNRVAALITSFNLDPTMTQVDFESTSDTWVVLQKDEVTTIGKAISQHIQSCFTWAKQMHEQINQMTTLDAALDVVLAINAFGVPTA